MVRTDSPSTRAARVRLPSHRASVCSTSSLSISPTVDPISKGTTSFGGREAGSGKSWVIEIFRDSVRFRRKHCENKTASGGWEYSVNKVLTAWPGPIQGATRLGGTALPALAGDDVLHVVLRDT